MTRYAVLRMPGSGPPALIAPPNDFATNDEAEARIAEIEAVQHGPHHTWLDILPYEGPLLDALAEKWCLM